MHTIAWGTVQNRFGAKYKVASIRSTTYGYTVTGVIHDVGTGFHPTVTVFSVNDIYRKHPLRKKELALGSSEESVGAEMLIMLEHITYRRAHKPPPSKSRGRKCHAHCV